MKNKLRKFWESIFGSPYDFITRCADPDCAGTLWPPDRACHFPECRVMDRARELCPPEYGGYMTVEAEEKWWDACFAANRELIAEQELK